MGRVQEIRVFPVRSLAGTAVPTAAIGPDGLAGDRTWTVVDADGRPVRAKEAPGIAGLDGAGVDEEQLSAAAGRPVHLAALPPQPGVAPVHLVSEQAIDRAARGEVPEGCSADDPRANLLVSLDEGGDERAWVGQEVRIGDAVLRVTRTPKHCLGVYADVVTPGTAQAGDAVLLIGNPGPSH
ncbi:hypothetical protein SAMN06272739_4014 [Blastococcus haudaquaticus]|uniref:MOSC domain-containing protein n=1 Tax=Blastococcus haudaquaticus TaxID=1938745 RepID=A0A286H5T7_9ACTN|nr:hypothetical protein SAMN06272739_4014 [Blastococcus haudaquaticus]